MHLEDNCFVFELWDVHTVNGIVVSEQYFDKINFDSENIYKISIFLIQKQHNSLDGTLKYDYLLDNSDRYPLFISVFLPIICSKAGSFHPTYIDRGEGRTFSRNPMFSTPCESAQICTDPDRYSRIVRKLNGHKLCF